MKYHLIFFSLSAALSLAPLSQAAEPEASPSAFLKPTIDLGCVVSDLDASVKFYTEAIGFTVAGGFQVDADYASRIGLNSGQTLDITILTLGEGDDATKLKLMQVEGAGPMPPNEFITSSLGFSYLTIFVKSTPEALARLAQAGVAPIAEGPLPLPDNLDPSLALTIVRDPDGNFVELVGPNATE